jgi:hypothetical protein
MGASSAARAQLHMLCGWVLPAEADMEIFMGNLKN